MVTAPARRELVRWMQTRGLSERRGLQIVRMSASALRYQPRPDRNNALRERIVALAQRHRRYGVGMIVNRRPGFHCLFHAVKVQQFCQFST
jgi:putative transposase